VRRPDCAIPISTRRGRPRRATAGLLLWACVAAVGCSATRAGSHSFLARLENSLVFAPSKYPEGRWDPPGSVFEDAWFSASDGTRLHGWFCPHPRPRAVVLFAHGNAGNLSDRAELVRMLRDRFDLAVLVFDYRGYGRSEGSPDEAGILLDARAARQWLAQRAGVAQADVVLMGRSLGGAVAIDLAATDGARGLIVESSFTSLPEVAAEHVFLPTKLLMRNRLDSLTKIADYRGPLLLSHGDADRLIPHEHGRRLFAAANGPKRMVTIRGGDHNDPQTPEYYQALAEFFAGLPPARADLHAASGPPEGRRKVR